MNSKILHGIFAFLFMISTSTLLAQEEVVYFIDSNQDEVATYVDNGNQGLKSFIAKNLKARDLLKGRELLLYFTVTEVGIVKNPRVVKGGDPRIDGDILKILCEARFNPASENGVIISSEVLLNLRFTGKSPDNLEANHNTTTQ